jgi:hypothetical protein
MNTPECLREGKVTTKGCIEHQFVAFGGITVLFMEVKLVLGTREERVNAIAQVYSPTLIWCMVSLADVTNCGDRF